MACSLSIQERLNCPRSYADEQSHHLLCEIGGICDGTLYDFCTWDKSFSEMMALITGEVDAVESLSKNY